jgi:hypothetical protein
MGVERTIMNRAKAVLTVVAALLGAGASAPALAWGHAQIRFGVVVGVPFYPWYYPYPYYPYPPYPVVVAPPAPTTYIEQGEAPPHSLSYWYYCAESNTYYPYVKDCPAGWMRVVPHAPPRATQPQSTPPAAPQPKTQSLPQTASSG